MNRVIAEYSATVAETPALQIAGTVASLLRTAAGAVLSGMYQAWQLALLVGFAVLSVIVYLVMKRLIAGVLAEQEPAPLHRSVWGAPSLKPVPVSIPRYSMIDAAVSLRTTRWQ